MNENLTVPRPANLSVEGASNSRLKALVIEDNPLDARLIQIMLNDAAGGQFKLERAERLGAGMEILAKGEIGIVLLDLSLADSAGGLATFNRVHYQVPHVPIIVMTGLDDETIAVQAVPQGPQDYLVKGQVTGPLLVRAMRYELLGEVRAFSGRPEFDDDVCLVGIEAALLRHLKESDGAP